MENFAFSGVQAKFFFNRQWCDACNSLICPVNHAHVSCTCWKEVRPVLIWLHMPNIFRRVSFSDPQFFEQTRYYACLFLISFFWISCLRSRVLSTITCRKLVVPRRLVLLQVNRLSVLRIFACHLYVCKGIHRTYYLRQQRRPFCRFLRQIHKWI